MCDLQTGKKGGKEVVLEENEEKATLAACVKPITPLLPLLSVLCFSPCVLSLSVSLILFTFSTCALTIPVLSVATDPYMIPVCFGTAYLPVQQYERRIRGAIR